LNRRLSYALAVVFLLVSMGLRAWQVTTLPFGLNEQEITNIRISETVRQGRIEVIYSATDQSQESLYHTTNALITGVIGNGVLGYRMLSLWAGLLTLALTYSLATRLYGRIAGLASTGFVGMMMLAILLSRLAVSETLVPLLVTATVLAMVRALPVYRNVLDQNTNTLAFAVFGILLGVSLYVHAMSLFLVLLCMAFIAYIVFQMRPLSYQRLSFIGFAILMMIIVSMPYLITFITRPELSAGFRLFNYSDGIIQSYLNGLMSIAFVGDANPIYNLPQRPLIDLASAVIVVVGLLTSIRQWRNPRYSVVLFVLVGMSPVAFLAPESPNFLAMSSLIPGLALAFGVGVTTLLQIVSSERTWLVIGSLGLIGIFNFVWISSDFFTQWTELEEVRSVYQTDLGQIAYYLDTSIDEIPTTLCYLDWSNTESKSELSDAELILLMMNRQPDNMRFIDCRTSMLFIDGGRRSQVVLPSDTTYDSMHPHIQEWIDRGNYVDIPNLPARQIAILNFEDEIASEMGKFTTTSPANYGDGEVRFDAPIPPPIRFEGNITWLGYSIPTRNYRVGETASIINYWRVEGIVPRDLTLFTHLLSDPVTIVGNRDTLSVNPLQLQERDVFVQVTELTLNENLVEGEYLLSVGTYEAGTGQRLALLSDTTGQQIGERLFLYSINIAPIIDENDIDTTDE